MPDDPAPIPARHSAQPSAQTAATTRAQAREHETLMLYWLHRFGYLTAPQVAALVYPRYRQGEHLARRVLLRLERRGVVLRRPGAPGERGYYALSQEGARVVVDVYELQAISGKDVLRQISPHRCYANDATIRMLRAGTKRVWTEREIQRGTAPFRSLGPKVPDALAADAEGGVTWVEVEASRRGGRDLQALAEWLVLTAFPPGLGFLVPLDAPQDTLFLERVRFVLAVQQAHSLPQRLFRALDGLLGRLDYDVHDYAANTLEFEIPGQPLRVGFE